MLLQTWHSLQQLKTLVNDKGHEKLKFELPWRDEKAGHFRFETDVFSSWGLCDVAYFQNFRKTSQSYAISRYLFACKCIPHTKYEKNPHWNTSFFVFFTTLELFWPKFCPKDHTQFTFFGWFFMKYVSGYN